MRPGVGRISGPISASCRTGREGHGRTRCSGRGSCRLGTRTLAAHLSFALDIVVLPNYLITELESYRPSDGRTPKSGHVAMSMNADRSTMRESTQCVSLSTQNSSYAVESELLKTTNLVTSC